MIIVGDLTSNSDKAIVVYTSGGQPSPYKLSF